MAAIPPPPPTRWTEEETTVFVPPIPDKVEPFDESTLSDFTQAEREAGKEVSVFYKERQNAEMAAGRKLTERNKKRAQFRTE